MSFDQTSRHNASRGAGKYYLHTPKCRRGKLFPVDHLQVGAPLLPSCLVSYRR